MNVLCLDVLIEVFRYCCINEPKTLLRFREVCMNAKIAIDTLMFSCISPSVEVFDIYGRQYFSNKMMKVGLISWIPRHNQLDVVLNQDCDLYYPQIKNHENIYVNINAILTNMNMNHNQLMNSLDLIFHPIDEYKKRLDWSWKKWISLNFPSDCFPRHVLFPSFSLKRPNFDENVFINHHIRSNRFRDHTSYTFFLKPYSIERPFPLVPTFSNTQIINYVPIRDFLKRILSSSILEPNE